MLITQLYRSDANPSLNDIGFEILQRWNSQTNREKQANIQWLAEQLRNKQTLKPTDIAVALAKKLGVTISDDFPPPKKP
jgi:hypothetical protein